MIVLPGDHLFIGVPDTIVVQQAVSMRDALRAEMPDVNVHTIVGMVGNFVYRNPDDCWDDDDEPPTPIPCRADGVSST